MKRYHAPMSMVRTDTNGAFVFHGDHIDELAKWKRAAERLARRVRAQSRMLMMYRTGTRNEKILDEMHASEQEVLNDPLAAQLVKEAEERAKGGT